MKSSVLVLPKYPRKGASSRLRTYQYLPFLEKLGWNFTVRALFDEEYLDSLYNGKGRSRLKMIFLYLYRVMVLCKFKRFDFIWLEKELFPYMPAWIEVLLKLFGVKYIVDYDDAIFHNYDLSSNRFIRCLLGNKIDVVMRHAYCVIAGNEYLAERAKLAGAKRVLVIPTVVDHHRYIPRKETSSGPLTLGWIGSPTTQKYLEILLPVFQSLTRQYQFRLLLVGATPEIKAKLAGITVHIENWSEDTEARHIQEMDVGIMPLQDGPWEKGKCGYKIIQYMASGVPVVASAVGVNTAIVSGSNSGMLANDFSEWESALAALFSEPRHRHQLGMSGRLAVERKYSIDSQLPRLQSCFLPGLATNE
jgi:glycosyltransferase involved in cell wall biosynthesis